MTATIVLAAAVLAAPVPAKSAELARIESLFGKPVDPDKQCGFKLDNAALTIRVPKGRTKEYSRLQPPLGSLPRTEREVTLPVEITVRVSVPAPPDFGPDEVRAKDWWAGILVWESDRKFVAYGGGQGTSQKGGAKGFATTHTVFTDAHVIGYTSQSGYNWQPEEPLWFRLVVTEESSVAYYSSNGGDWLHEQKWEIKLPAKVKFGVAAYQSCGCDLAAEFSRFEFRQPK